MTRYLGISKQEGLEGMEVWGDGMDDPVSLDEVIDIYTWALELYYNLEEHASKGVDEEAVQKFYGKMFAWAYR